MKSDKTMARDCIQCENMYLRIKSKKNCRKKYEVYCQLDQKCKGCVSGTLDVLMPEICPKNK